MNCMNCHRLHIHGNTIFCPFFEMQPCINGEHYIKELPSKPQATPQKEDAREKEIIAFYETTPVYIPMARKTNSFWEANHEKIFEMRRQGFSNKAIAKEVGISYTSIVNYFGRYDPNSHLYVEKRGN